MRNLTLRLLIFSLDMWAQLPSSPEPSMQVRQEFLSSLERTTQRTWMQLWHYTRKTPP
jgi:hypothetical protein